MRTLTLEVYTPEERMPEEDAKIMFRPEGSDDFYDGYFHCDEWSSQSFFEGFLTKEIAEWAYMP